MLGLRQIRRKAIIMVVNLTEGAIERICRDDISCCVEAEEFGPMLQVIDVKLYHLLMSDGTHSNVGLLSLGLKELVLHMMLQKRLDC